MKQIQCFWFALTVLSAMAIAGCGGGSGSSSGASGSKATTGKATITVVWPAKSRLVPLAAASINVVITQGTSIFVQQLITPPAGGGPSIITFTALPVGTLGITASAYPNANGTGVVQATGTAPLVIHANQNTGFSLTMNSTITHVIIGPVYPIWNGRAQPLAATAYDAANEMVLTTPAKWTWSSGSTGVASVTTDANPTSITGISTGASLLTATETESGISSTATVTVIQPGLAPLPWAKFQANAGNTGMGSGTGATGSTKWSFATGGTIFSSMAIGADTTVYVGSSDKNLYAVTSSGSKVWSFATGGQVTCPAIGADGTIYVGSLDGNLYAVHPDGTLKWSYSTGTGIYANPAIGPDGTVYAASYRGFITAVDGLTGTKKWTFTTGSLIYASPAVGSDGTIYVGCDNIASDTNVPTNEMFAINANGSQKWTYSDGYGIDAAAAITSNGTVYFGTYDNTLHALNSSGSQIWSYTFSTGAHGPITAPAIAANGTVYFGTAEGHLYAVNSSGAKAWAFTLGGPYVSTPAIGGDGTIYVGYSNATIGTTGQFYAVSTTGTQNWVVNSGPVEGSSAVGPDGTIYTTGGVNMLAIH